MGVMHVLSQVREKFWVIKGHAAVRYVLSRCVRCHRAHGKAIEQLMADLPPDRVESGEPPFYRTGVNLFGPFFIKRGRAQMKHWGVIFTSWERLIGTVRRVLDIVLGTQKLNYEGLCTLFCEVEATVNSRPLTVVTSDSRDPVPLTPNKLLNMGDSPVGCDVAIGGHSKQRWKQVQHMAEQFWAR
ncbi:uncharacterized protein [Palaemon carinicauda]|uniref:uncharacterized protein n=1 Tax=Palaemon carinicauda TaxID=392227 RepID=UPI0035B66F5C